MHNKYFLGFSVFEGIGPVKMGKLLKTFHTAKDAWNGDETSLKNILGEKITTSFIQLRNTFSIDEYVEKLHKKNIQFVTIADKNYPELLLEAISHPFLLYVKGDISLLNYPRIIAIVGTRKVTPYGQEVTETFTRQLVGAGFVTVSGLAFGVDAITHTSTIDNYGKTIAVLGCGVDCCTPISNQKIYNKILENGGLVVSALPPGTGASVGSFPARNAIIAGLSRGVLVTEGAHDSGALITAEDAKKLQRPIFAVPGPITSDLSQGPNSLLGKGAIPATKAQDILDRLGIIETQKSQAPFASRQIKSQKFETKEELEILSILKNGPLHFDEIVRTIGKPASEIGSLLTIMEVKRIVRSNTGMYTIII